MYTLMAIDREGTAPGAVWQRIPWEDYGFDPHIRHADMVNMAEAVRTQKPDAVFLDIDGLIDMGSPVEEICQGHHFCPCVVISGEGDTDHMRKAMRAGAFDYCTRPVTRDTLLEIVCALKKRLDERSKGSSAQGGRLAEIMTYIEAHYQEKLSLAGIAETFYMSKNYLCYYFKRHMGVNFVDYLSSLRIDKAKALLVSSMTLDEIAEKTGFSDTSYFIKVFKKYEGISPGAYRNSI